ncbi:hypothetical protein JW979_01655 [bacterium]|nr:hypothetical protein [candidate division CSSED10-310 bacterium]
MIKVYGYNRQDNEKACQDDAFEPVLQDLQEISFVASPRILKKIGEFLIASAQEIEIHKKNFGHNHFSHFWKEWERPSCDIIVVNDGSAD